MHRYTHREFSPLSGGFSAKVVDGQVQFDAAWHAWNADVDPFSHIDSDSYSETSSSDDSTASDSSMLPLAQLPRPRTSAMGELFKWFWPVDVSDIRPEKRISFDGRPYTKSEFMVFFGSTTQWDCAPTYQLDERLQTPSPQHAGGERRIRVKKRLKYRVEQRLERSLSPPCGYMLFESSRERRTFIYAPTFLKENNIFQLHALLHHRSVREIKDRKDGLQYRHKAYRIESPLRAHAQQLYDYLMGAVMWSDRLLWQKMTRDVFPEIEYIVYDARSGVPGVIEPHVDNESAVTAVVMLSDPADFRGGASCFAPAESSDPFRQIPLQQGDAVFFRGEKLTHWITPVTAGVRIILQVECSRM